MTLNISSVFTYDEDAGNYIQAVEGASGDNQALEPATRQAINNFVVGCKQDGIWDAIKASCILAGARTLAGALQPLVGTAPTNYNFVSGDYDRKTGLVGDGSTKYLDSNRNNNADPQDSKHLSVFIATLGTASAQYLIAGGGYLDNGNSSIYRVPSSFRGRINVPQGEPSAIVDSGINPAPSFIGMARSASNLQTIKVQNKTVFNTFASTAPLDISIRVFSGPDTQTLRSNSRIAFYSIGESLDLAKLDSRVTDLITAFGAAIP